MRGLFWLVLVALVGVSLALPSDLIQTAPYSPVIELRGTTSDSAKAIDATNAPLTKAVKWQTADLGVYNSEKVSVDQDAEAPAGVPAKILNFSKQTPAIPSSIGNASLENVTIINETMAWF